MMEYDWEYLQREKKKREKLSRTIGTIFLIGYFLLFAGILFIPNLVLRLIGIGIWICFFAILIAMGIHTQNQKDRERILRHDNQTVGTIRGN